MTMTTFQACPRKHLFDPRLHTLCPYCGVAMGHRGPAPSPMPSPSPSPSWTKPDEERPAEPRLPDWQPSSGGATRTFGSSDGPPPVVGWLVCIAGPGQGDDHRLYPGHNQLDIDDAGKLMVTAPEPARRRLAMLSFDARSTVYWMTEGTTRRLIYINGRGLDEPRHLSAGDLLELDIGHFLFVPLCGDHFRWNGEERLPRRPLESSDAPIPGDSP